MRQTPSPVFDGAQLGPALRRNHPENDILAKEFSKDTVGLCNFIGTIGRPAFRLFVQLRGVLCKVELLFQDGLVGCKESFENILKVWVVNFSGWEAVRRPPAATSFSHCRPWEVSSLYHLCA